MREAVKQFAVVGEKQETAALQVESSNVLEIMVSRRQVIVNRAAALRVVLGANATSRLVEHDDFCFLVCRELQQLSVNRHLVLGFVHLMAEVRDRFSVYLYATVGDEFVCGTAASKTTERNVLVYTHFFHPRLLFVIPDLFGTSIKVSVATVCLQTVMTEPLGLGL